MLSGPRSRRLDLWECFNDFGTSEARSPRSPRFITGPGYADCEGGCDVTERARALASKSPLAVLGTKQAMLHARDHSVREGLEFVAMMNSARLTSEDLGEAMAAKFARRAPTFSKL